MMIVIGWPPAADLLRCTSSSQPNAHKICTIFVEGAHVEMGYVLSFRVLLQRTT